VPDDVEAAMTVQEGAWDLVLMELTWYAPTLLVLGVGIFLALWRWQRHRRVSLLAIVGALLFLSGFAYSLWLDWTISSYEPWQPIEDTASNARLIRLLASGLQALGVACLIGAIFIDRRTAAAARKAVE
jgi:hypothetical protein